MNMIPFDMNEAQERLKALMEFDVDIYLQPEREARVGQENIPLWVKDYGFSQRGLSLLIEKRKKWYEEGHGKTHVLEVGDRLAVFCDVNGGGIGVVKEISGDEMYYTLFSPTVVYHKKVKDIKWNEQNWRWETHGNGSTSRLEKVVLVKRRNYREVVS